MEEAKRKMVFATFRIQNSLETLIMYSDEEKVKEYLKKLEDLAEYYTKEEYKLIKKEEK